MNSPHILEQTEALINENNTRLLLRGGVSTRHRCLTVESWELRKEDSRCLRWVLSLGGVAIKEPVSYTPTRSVASPGTEANSREVVVVGHVHA